MKEIEKLLLKHLKIIKENKYKIEEQLLMVQNNIKIHLNCYMNYLNLEELFIQISLKLSDVMLLNIKSMQNIKTQINLLKFDLNFLMVMQNNNTILKFKLLHKITATILLILKKVYWIKMNTDMNYILNVFNMLMRLLFTLIHLIKY